MVEKPINNIPGYTFVFYLIFHDEILFCFILSKPKESASTGLDFNGCDLAHGPYLDLGLSKIDFIFIIF